MQEFRQAWNSDSQELFPQFVSLKRKFSKDRLVEVTLALQLFCALPCRSPQAVVSYSKIACPLPRMQRADDWTALKQPFLIEPHCERQRPRLLENGVPTKKSNCEM